MKKLLVLALTLVLLAGFASCGGDADIDTAALSSEVMSSSGLFEAELISTSESVVNNVVGVDTSNCESVEFYMGTAVTGEEFGVFVCNTAKDAKNVKAQLETHNADYQTQYADYAPDYVPLIKNAIIRQEGRYVVYLAALDNQQAKAIVDKYFG